MSGRVLTGDCLQHLAALPDACAALVLTSPPYNIGKEYETRRNLDDFAAWQTAVIAECARVVRPGGSICWQVGNYVNDGEIVPLDILLYPAFKAHGLSLRNRIVWTFGHGVHCARRLSGRYETVLWFTKGDDYLFNLDPIRIPQKYPGKRHFKGPRKGELSGNPLGKNPGDVWDIPNVKHNHPEKTAHPCQFPEALVQPLVLALTNPGDLVVDPFAGSGTVGVVSARLDRSVLLIELRADYAEIACNRLFGDDLFIEAA